MGVTSVVVLSKHKNQQNMNISLSKHSNSSSKIYIISIFLSLSTHLESLVLAGLAHVIVNAPALQYYPCLEHMCKYM
jgi:hypothetical protein